MAVIIGIGVAGFYFYKFLTDVSKNDISDAIATYSIKCGIVRNDVADDFGYFAAEAAKQPAAEMQEAILSIYKVRTGQGSASDVIKGAWFNIKEELGYNHDQRIEQAAMKAGLEKVKDAIDSCNLSKLAVSYKKLSEAISTPANILSNPDQSPETLKSTKGSDTATAITINDNEAAATETAQPTVTSSNSVRLNAIVKEIEPSESGDGYSFSTQAGQQFYVYNAGGVQLRPGEELIKQDSKICLVLHPEDGMGDISSVTAGTCRSE